MIGIDIMISIKVSVQGAPHDLNLSQFLGTEDNTHEGCQFHVNSSVTQADHWFVIDGQSPNDSFCRTSTVTFLSAEHVWESGHFSESKRYRNYLSQFDRVYTSQDLFWNRAVFAPPFLPWMINANHGPDILSPHERDIRFLKSLHELPKPETLSVICSTKTMSSGHRLRLRFVEELSSEFGDSLHWYGNGVRSVAQKWDAIAPYRFHLALENQSTYGCFSEKIYDALLGLSLPFYWGAPDLARYFPPDSFVPLNIRDLKGSVALIRRAIDERWDLSRAPAVLKGRDLVLGEFNVFKRIARIAQELTEARPSLRDVQLTPLPKEPIGRRLLTLLSRGLDGMSA